MSLLKNKHRKQFSLAAVILSTFAINSIFGAPNQAQRRTAIKQKKAVKINNSNSNPQVLLGIDVLEKALSDPKNSEYQHLKKERVGLLTHYAAVNSKGKLTFKVLHESKKVNLVALFCPEHGLDSKDQAGNLINNSTEVFTRLPIYSLHGAHRQPTQAMLAKIDTMIIDLQDIGVRSYTYISCMRYTVEACLRNNVKVIVLDRPNPLGGIKMSGPMIDSAYMSYVGAFIVPYVHGMTIGELAKMIKDPSQNHRELPVMSAAKRKSGSLKIIPMQGWKRSMQWQATGLKWMQTSPKIPSLSAVLGYTTTGIGLIKGPFSNGCGTIFPFRIITASNQKDLDYLYNDLCKSGIKGVAFSKKSLQGNKRKGIYLKLTNWAQFNPGELTLHLMRLSVKYSDKGKNNIFQYAGTKKESLMNHIIGEEFLLEKLRNFGASLPIKSILNKWDAELKNFSSYRKKFLLYR